MSQLVAYQAPQSMPLSALIFERALSEAWVEPARRFPHFGSIKAL
jgi:hypothetical protein